MPCIDEVRKIDASCTLRPLLKDCPAVTRQRGHYAATLYRTRTLARRYTGTGRAAAVHNGFTKFIQDTQDRTFKKLSTPGATCFSVWALHTALLGNLCNSLF